MESFPDISEETNSRVEKAEGIAAKRRFKLYGAIAVEAISASGFGLSIGLIGQESKLAQGFGWLLMGTFGTGVFVSAEMIRGGSLPRYTSSMVELERVKQEELVPFVE